MLVYAIFFILSTIVLIPFLYHGLMDIQQKIALINYLAFYSTPNKIQKMADCVQYRTRHVTVVLEDIFQPHNASAILRSAECFGIQDVHIIERRNRFRATEGIAMGSAKWLDLHYYQETTACFDKLKKDGYKIVATTPRPDAYSLQELPLTDKMALVFGTEFTGLTEQALAQADLFVTIPMYGFTQSYNVSVSAALCTYQITESLKKSSVPWQLSEEERVDLTLSWLRRSIKAAPALEQLFLSTQQNQR